MRHFLILSLLIISIQLIACNPKDLWENDNTVKDVSTVESVNNTSVEIVFNYEVEELSAEDPANYSIAGLEVISAVRDDIDLTRVELITSSQEAIEYSIVITNIERADGELVDTSEDSDTFTGDAVPYVVDITWISSSSIAVNFSEDVESTSANIAANYSIEGVDLSVLDVLSAAASGASVTLVTDFQNDIEYTVTISNVSDMNGNIINPASNSGTFIGNACPRLVNVMWRPNNNIDVIFSEAVELTSAEDRNNYTILEGLSVDSAVRDATDHHIVHLSTGNQLVMEYTLRVSNVKDLSGEILDPNPSTDTFIGDASPKIQSVNYNGSTTIELLYSENMNSNALVIANYQLYDINDAIYITIISTQVGATDNEILLWLGSTNLQAGHVYELAFDPSIQDTVGNNLLEPHVIQLPYPLPYP